MGTRGENKLTSDVSADHSVSLDSLSFVGLVSIPYQNPKPPLPNQENKTDPEFEFASTRPDLNAATNPTKITTADLLISNGQLQPQALTFQSSQSWITNPHSFRGSLEATDHSNKRSTVKTDNRRQYGELHDASKPSKKESTGSRTKFGGKFFGFLKSPCQECRAIKPGTMEAQTTVGENAKIY